jgi:hypothetical protein
VIDRDDPAAREPEDGRSDHVLDCGIGMEALAARSCTYWARCQKSSLSGLAQPTATWRGQIDGTRSEARVRPDERPDVSAIGLNHAPWLHPDLIDAVARRFLELLRQEATATGADHPDLLTVAEVAARLKMSPKWDAYAPSRQLALPVLDEPVAPLDRDPSETRNRDA